MSSSVQIGSSSMSGTGEAWATAALASQSSESHGCSKSSMPVGVEGADKGLALFARIGAVGVETDRGASAERLLDGFDAVEIAAHILADLDLERPEALVEPILDFGRHGFAVSVEFTGVSSGSRVSCRNIEQRRVFEHFERADQSGRGDLVGFEVLEDPRFGVVDLQARGPR